MKPPLPLSDQQITSALAALPAWRRDGETLTRTYVLPSFLEALAFMQDCAAEIERLNHHPEWTNCYNRLTITLSTHDAGDRITALDVELAKHLEWVSTRFQ